jgi:hypothetical protein
MSGWLNYWIILKEIVMMNKSETIVKLAAALVKAQAEWPVIGKDSSGHHSKYAPLDKIIAAVRPILASNDLSFVQMPGVSEHVDQIVLTSMLIHSSGEFLEEIATIPLPKVGKANEAQCYGAGLTYLRRYSLEAMLGIAATEDTDAGNGTQRSGNGQQPVDTPLDYLPEDEQIIAEGEAVNFWINVVALIDRYTVAQHAQAAAKQLGYKVVPGKALERLEMYRALREQAAKRDYDELLEDAAKEAVEADET